MPKSLALSKVQKSISKKKGKGAAIHEHSRDSRRLQRASARDEKLVNKLIAREKVNGPHLQRISFFQQATSTHTSPYTLPTIQTLISEFIHRSDTELADLKAERRPGRPPSKREDELKQQMERDEKEHASGYWIPDMQDGDNLKMLEAWGGDWVGLNTMKFVRVSRDGTMVESSFPPKGQS